VGMEEHNNQSERPE